MYFEGQFLESCRMTIYYYVCFQVVISNILQTRRKTVVIVTASEENAIWMSDSELEQGKDIEEKIVADLAKKHSEFIRSNSLPGNYFKDTL